ncbi:MAG: class I SAM-dependent RNA methyltransferase [Hyphomicrobiaceae bacterium]
MADGYYTAWKAGLLTQALVRQGLVSRDSAMIGAPYQVPPGSRRRGVFSAVATPDGCRLGFHEHRSHELVDLSACAVLRPRLVAALPFLREIVGQVGRRDETCRVTVLETDHGLDVCVDTEGGKRSRPAASTAALARIAGDGNVLRLTVDGEPVLLRATPRITISGVQLAPPPGAFVQATREAEEAIAKFAVEAVSGRKAKQVADLFCGLGAFTFPLAQRSRVEGYDSEAPLVDALRDASRHAKGLKPVAAHVRDLFRDPLSPIELGRFDAVVFDPPRAGAKAQAEALAKSTVGTVVAVSCNPTTLARDLSILVEGGYELQSAVAIDQFLFTAHLEAVAVLTRPAPSKRPRRT